MAGGGEDRERSQGRAGRAITWPLGGRVRSRAADLSEGAPAFLIEKIRGWIAAEAGPGRLLPWVPVAFGTGIAAYFAADREPVASVAAVTAFALCVSAFVARRNRIFPLVVMFAALSAGFATAALKTARVAHGVLARPMFSVTMKGFVEARDERERTDRFVLRVEEMESPRGTTKLERVRLSVKKGTAPAVGSFVELKARLLPPLSPLRPGSYDFGRDMYFQGIGASGFAMGAIKTVEAPRSGGTYLRYAAAMQGMR
ncbi:MAG TPA: ComEC/Rec2 family competence protein, partial [Afipia sp.]